MLIIQQVHNYKTEFSDMDAAIAAQNGLECVLEAKAGERIVIFCDDSRAQVGEAFEAGALNLKLDTKLVLLETRSDVFRTEIPPQLNKYLNEERPHIYINLFRGTHQETPFRIKFIQAETRDKKTRLGHCPGVNPEMLTDGALALTADEHREMQTFAQMLMGKLHDAQKIEITTPAGTKLRLSVKARAFITDTALDWELMKWMNLPTGEVFVAPVEDSLEGKMVCDMAIGGIGPVDKLVGIKVRKGKVEAVTCDNPETLRKVQNSLHIDDMAKVVGEFAFGINPKARFVKEFLEAEKLLGTVHIAFGANLDMPGGKNDSANHMDFMMNKPTVKAILQGGTKITLLADGVFQTDNPPPAPEQEETLPISDFYKVIDYQTIYKTDVWWEAVVIFETYNRRQIGMYLWQKRGGVWKRKNKFSIRNLYEWGKIKNVVDQLFQKIANE
ncbi:MAG: aminopeptidase [Candidatus Bathyarchaeota archaeon]|nr:aminopeptidase [Candidatus Bathyarchaeota archaeon]